VQHTETTFIGDIRWWPKWIEDITDVEVPSGEMAEGTRLSYKFRGRPAYPTITAYEQGSTIGISSSEDRYEFAEAITLHADGDQTAIDFTMEIEPKVWWMKALAAVVGPFKGTLMGRSMRREMEMLKSAVEAENTGPA
jgi:hypothetical protein